MVYALSSLFFNYFQLFSIIFTVIKNGTPEDAALCSKPVEYDGIRLFKCLYFTEILALGMLTLLADIELADRPVISHYSRPDFAFLPILVCYFVLHTIMR